SRVVQARSAGQQRQRQGGAFAMQDIVHNSPICNGGHGGTAVNGRGGRRRKLTLEQRIGLATDVSLGLPPFSPSIGQAATAFGVSPYNVRHELKARAAAKKDAERQAALAREGTKDIVEAWDTASDWGREEAIRVLGVADVWDVLARIVG